MTADLDSMRHLSRARRTALGVSGCGGRRRRGGRAGGRTGGGRVVPITERDFRISAPRSLHAGAVPFRVHNLGPDTHESDRACARARRLPLRADGLTVDEEALEPRSARSKARSAADRRSSGVRLTPGRYVLFCNMAGHYLGGMRATIVVVR